MPQFSVYPNPRPGSAKHAPFLLDVQSDLVETSLRVVIPLVRPSYFGPVARRLNPVLQVEGRKFVLSPAEIGSLPAAHLKGPVTQLSEHRTEILDALDLLFHGF